MSIDRRSRVDGDPPLSVDAAMAQLAEGLDRHADLLGPGLAWLELRPLTVELTDGDRSTWSLHPGATGVTLRPGAADSGAHWRIEGQGWSDVVTDQSTPMGRFSSGRLDLARGRLNHLLDWWLVLRGALDGRPIHTPGALELQDAEGRPLDLRRSFTPDDDPDEMAAFLEAAGFLHLRGWYSPAEMAAVSADIDRAVPEYHDGDGRSWWTTVADGSRRLVRLHGFHRHSDTVAELLADERLGRLAELTGDGHRPASVDEANPIEALIKPLGVVEGISDVPWHTDCSLGRHSYECARLTVGISVTAGGQGRGQLRVRPGSHRALVWPALEQPGLDLPDLALPTEVGDVTVHQSCTLHMAEPPTAGERQVMYTDLRFPLDPDAAAAARRRLYEVREAASVTVSQPAAASTR